MTPIELTKAEFIQRVGNFEENPKDWKYVGDKPCIDRVGKGNLTLSLSQNRT